MKEIAKILEELRAHPEARDLMNAKADAKGTEDEARLYGEIASRLGYEAGTQEFLDYISGTGEALRQRTDAAAESIRELPEEELAEAAGGADHKNCYDTYKDKENCWWTDGCDVIHENYKGYQCKRNNECSNRPHYVCKTGDFCAMHLESFG